MSNRVRYRGCKHSRLGTEVPPCWIMEGTQAWELFHSKKPQLKVPGTVTLDGHMAECDARWRKLEGRKPFAELNERERMLEGAIPWDPKRLKELDDEHHQRMV